MIAPGWLAPDAPQVDVVLSSRARIMRNLRGLRFPNRATGSELECVMRSVGTAAEESGLDLECFRSLTNAERDYFVGCRLVSPDFRWTLPNRTLWVNRERTLSVMVNEEDHIRLQAVTAGWSSREARHRALAAVEALGRRLEFARSPRFGYLSASPPNSGSGQRLSAMFHLLGLAQTKRMSSVLLALGSQDISIRGLFGEGSRAIGAFTQVSTLRGSEDEFDGACDYLIQQEREARAQIGEDAIRERADQARELAASAERLSLADALRVFGWVRLATFTATDRDLPATRKVDQGIAAISIRATKGDESAMVDRANFVRAAIG